MIEKLVREWKKVYLNDLGHLVHEFKDSLDEPAVVILEGEMGAGKTTFTKECLEEGQEGNSPTYSILYESGEILHADFYRIESDEDVIHLEIPEYLDGKKLFMVEWGKKYINRLEREVPDNFHFYTLKIDIIEDDESQNQRRNYKLFEVEDL